MPKGGGGISQADIVFAVALALVGIGVSIHLATRRRLGRCLAFGCYLGAAELFASLANGLSLLPRVVAGAAAALIFLMWEVGRFRIIRLAAPERPSQGIVAGVPPPPAGAGPIRREIIREYADQKEIERG
jgi:hypothetical protein